MWGQLIRKAREEKGWTQRHLAELMDVEQPSVWRWENGESPVSDDRKPVLAEKLGKTEDELFPRVTVA